MRATTTLWNATCVAVFPKLTELDWHADFGDSGPGEALKQADFHSFFRSVNSFNVLRK